MLAYDESELWFGVIFKIHVFGLGKYIIHYLQFNIHNRKWLEMKLNLMSTMKGQLHFR